MRVLKFGGSSVADAACIERVLLLVAAARAEGPVAVVASAMAGVTDLLAAAVEGREGADRGVVARLRRRHHDCLARLAPGDDLARRQLDHHLDRLQRALETTTTGRFSPAARDAVLASGEQLLVPVLAAALRASGTPAALVDSRLLIATDSQFGAASVDLRETRRRVTKVFGGWPEGLVAVVPGYSGADPHGRVTTLGRGGSDTTAAVLGVALGAAWVEIWTDVDGVLSAPPGAVPEAHVLPHLSYAEAEAIARYGGKVLHFNTIAPCAGAGIAIAVRNTFRPEAPGTVVDGNPAAAGRIACVTGCAGGGEEAGRAAVLAVVGDGVARVPGLAARVYRVLAEHGIAVQQREPCWSPVAWRVLVDPGRLGDALRALHPALVTAGARPALPSHGRGADSDRGAREQKEVRLLGEVCHG